MAKRKPGKSPASQESNPAGSSERKASIPRGVRKHLRELETQLTDAARKERKQLAKVERAARRRRAIDAKLDKLHSRIAPETQAPAPEDTETPVD
jgi:uncharacterized sporulation protein YeaH/YhbH (DUF444 family)